MNKPKREDYEFDMFVDAINQYCMHIEDKCTKLNQALINTDMLLSSSISDATYFTSNEVTEQFKINSKLMKVGNKTPDPDE